jgi:glutamyl-tRNA reductase
MVIGETQITGQLKTAFKLAVDNQLASKFLSRVIHFAFKCSSIIRNSSDISKNSVSIASIAILKLEESFSNLEHKKVIVIGVGEMSSLVIKNLVDKNMDVYVFNRSIENIKIFKEKYKDNITINLLSSLKEYINDIDILFTATGSDNAIITDDFINDNTNKKIWFDLALPKDIQVDTIKYNHITISSIKDLEEIAKKNTSLREEQAQIAYSLIGENIDEFLKWQSGLDVSPVLGKIREKAKRISKDEISKAIKKNFIKKEDEENIEKLIHVIFNKFLHSTGNNLRKISNDPDVDFAIDNLKFLFDIDESENNLHLYKCEHYSNE